MFIRQKEITNEKYFVDFYFLNFLFSPVADG